MAAHPFPQIHGRLHHDRVSLLRHDGRTPLIPTFPPSRMFPGFIDESARQGANPDVIAKLQFFQSMHNVRTVFRGSYAVALIILAVDGLTAKQKLNHQEYVLEAIVENGG